MLICFVLKFTDMLVDLGMKMELLVSLCFCRKFIKTKVAGSTFASIYAFILELCPEILLYSCE